MYHISLSQRLSVLTLIALLLASCGGTSPQVAMSNSAANASAPCAVENGQWSGVVAFTASNCVISNLVLYLYSGDAGYGSVYMVYAQGEIRIENNQLAYQETLDGGTLSIKGTFTSPTAVQGTYAVTKGSKIGGGTATVLQDINQEWKAAPKTAETPVAIVADTPEAPKAAPPTVAPSPTIFIQPSPTPQPTTSPTPRPTSTPAFPPGRWSQLADLPRQINAVIVDPANPKVLYAGAGQNGSGSGVYKSEDAGLTWQLASTGLPAEDVAALVISQAETPTLYAAVGVRGYIYASTDGAQSWKRIGNTELFGGFERRLYRAATNAKLLFSLARPGGLARSRDGGRTWTPIDQGLPKDEHEVYVLSLAIDPTDANVIYAGTGGFVGQGHGVYKSTDGGDTWSPINRGMIDYRLTAIAVNPAKPQTIYAGSDAGELFKSTDAGQTWDDLTEQLPLRQESHSAIEEIFLDPAKPDTLYLLCDRVGILASSDGGLKWSALGMPGQSDSQSLTAMTVLFGPSPILILGLEREGGWRYAPD